MYVLIITDIMITENIYKIRSSLKGGICMKDRKRKIWLKTTVWILAVGLLSAGCGKGGKNYSTSAGDSKSDSSSAYGSEGGLEGSGEIMEEVSDDALKTEGEMDASDAVRVSDSQNEKLIYTYRYSVETKVFDTFVQTMMEQVQKLGGYVEHSETNGSAGESSGRKASMTLRIPAEQMNQLLSLVKEESNVVYDSVSSENVTLRYVDMESHVRALRTEQKTLLRLIEKAEKIEDVIALQSQLTQVRYEIESYESQLRTMDNLVSYSTLYLDITEVRRTTTVTDQKTSFTDEITGRFSDNLYAVGQWLRNFTIGLIGSLPVLVPLALVLTLAVYLLRKWGKHQRSQRPPRNIPGSYQSIYPGKEKGQDAQAPKKERAQEKETDGEDPQA